MFKDPSLMDGANKAHKLNKDIFFMSFNALNTKKFKNFRE